MRYAASTKYENGKEKTFLAQALSTLDFYNYIKKYETGVRFDRIKHRKREEAAVASIAIEASELATTHS